MEWNEGSWKVIPKTIKPVSTFQLTFIAALFATIQIINRSWTKIIAIIVNVCVFFYAKVSLDFSSNFYALDFLRFAWSKILSQSQFQAAELNLRPFNTKSQIKSAPQLVSFFTLNLNSGIC